MYTSITIIFNPNSTGDAPKLARELAKKLKEVLPKVPLHLKETERAGHAEELAYKAAKHGKVPLIISSSGDGGYHEVINGALKAQEEGHSPVCAVLAAGNANDHHRMVKKQPLFDAIVANEISEIDVLEISWGKERRFAHSYIGLGITPVVAVELNRHTLNAFKEMSLVLKTYWNYQPFGIEINNEELKLNSLVISNIPGMAKVLKLSENGKIDDGKFEIAMVPQRNKFSMVIWALKSATLGLGRQPQAETMEFKTLEDMPMQFDGEVTELPAHSEVKVSVANRMLRTVR